MKIKINSTAISEMNYNSGTRTLAVTFTSEKIYDYLNVPKHIIEEFLNADSKGKYFNYFIRNNFESIQRL